MILVTEHDTCNYALKFAQSLTSSSIVLLCGDLGAGKTFMAREIIKYFCNDNTIVTSPTFNILKIYEAKNFSIYHYDLYRIKNFNEIYELGIQEALGVHLCLIEWPEIIIPIIPKPYIKLELQSCLDGRVCNEYLIN